MPISLSPVPPPWSAAAWRQHQAVLGVPVLVWEAGRSAQALRWQMQRNCSLSPRQLVAVYLSLCVVSLLIAGAFFLQGATPVLAFAGLELLALSLALLVYARHAGDHETLTLAGRQLRVQRLDGTRRYDERFRAEWLAVEPSAGQGSLVELSGDGRRVRVGRFLRPEQRAAFAQELRRALRRACLVLPGSEIRSESQEP